MGEHRLTVMHPSRWCKHLGSAPAWVWALATLVVLMAITWQQNPAFLRPINLINILHQNAVVGIVAVGMTLVIILAGIDLSVGSLLALSGGLGIMTLNRLLAGQEVSEVAAVLAAMGVMVGVGAVAGAINGSLIAWGKVAPFIATLGALVAFRSGATWLANGGQFFSQGSDLLARIGQGIAIPGTNVGRPEGPVVPMELPWAVLVWLLAVGAGHVVLHHTRLGRHIVAVGANQRAARYAAIPVERVKCCTYLLIGLFTGIAAVMSAARYESVNSAGTGLLLELDVIAAVVIGGTRMEGGSGSVVGTMVGVVLIGVIKNVMVMLNVTSHAHGLVMGVIIVAAVLAQQFARRWAA